MGKLSESEKQEVKELIAERLCIEVEKVLDDSVLQDDLNSDSLDNIDIVMSLESKFDINIHDDDYDEVTTVKSLYEIVERYIQ